MTICDFCRKPIDKSLLSNNNLNTIPIFVDDKMNQIVYSDSYENYHCISRTHDLCDDCWKEIAAAICKTRIDIENNRVVDNDSN